MEFLQTIWNSLTTENEVIVNIISVPLIFLEVYMLMLVYTALLNVNGDKKQKLMYVISVSIFSIFSRYIIPSPYNAFINYIIIFLSIFFIFKTTIFKALACLFVPLLFTALIESIVTKVYFTFFNIDYMIGANIPIHRLVVNLLVFVSWILLIKIIKYFKVNFNSIQVLDKKKKISLILSTVLGIILICLQAYVTYFYYSVLPLHIVVISLIGLFTYVIVNIYTLFTVSKLETTSTNLEEAQLYNKTLEILHDNTRAFRHDFTNILIGMNGFIENNDMEGLKKYHSQLLEDIKVTNNLTTLSPKVVNNPAVYNVLANKYYKADNLGIKINLEVFIDLNELHMKIYEFTRVLGILMDNAIEASKECDKKIINVSIRKDNRKHMQLLAIENTYNNKDVDTEKIYEKGFSTKEGNTGLGLWEIRQILKKNNNLNLYTTKNEEYFSQQFEIYY